MPPLVSVILPVLNQEKYLEHVLTSLLSQDSVTEEVEIVVVDNGSNDGSIEIAKSFTSITVLEESDPGSYAARNHGIMNSSGELAVFLDPDCVPSPGWLAAAITSFDNPDVEVALGPRLPNSTGVINLLQSYENAKIQWILEQKLLANVYAYTNNMAARRSLFSRLGLFRHWARGADTFFAQMVVHNYGAQSITYAPEMCVTHLELQQVSDYFRKRLVYGASNDAISRRSDFRSLSIQARISILISMLRSNLVDPCQALILLGLLAPASLLYDSARLLNGQSSGRIPTR